VEVTPIHHLFAAVTAGAPTAMFDDDEADDGQYLALWLCPQGATPTHFTGEEEQVGGTAPGGIRWPVMLLLCVMCDAAAWRNSCVTWQLYIKCMQAALQGST
jgi:hypothetical protein